MSVSCISVTNSRASRIEEPRRVTYDIRQKESVSKTSLPWHLLRTDLRWAYRGLAKPRYCDRWVDVPHISAWLVLSGEASVRTPAFVRKAVRGEWLIAPPGKRMQRTSPECEILSICFVCEWPDGHEAPRIPRGLSFLAREAPALETLGRQLAGRARCREENQPLKPAPRDIPEHLEIQGEFRLWLAHFFRETERRGAEAWVPQLDSRVEQAVRILSSPEAGFPRPGELARQVGLSLSRLNQLFLRDLDLSVSDYGNRQKVASARTLLATSALSVKEAAFQLGFVSPQHFARWFRKHSGMSPSQAIKSRDNLI